MGLLTEHIHHHELSLKGSQSSLARVDLAGLSDKGRVRTNNEDHYLIARGDRQLTVLSTNLPAKDFAEASSETAYGLLVADGIGGTTGGGIASRMAVSLFIDLVIHTPDWIMRPENDPFPEVLRRMEERFLEIRNALIDKASTDQSLRSMGTTLTLACSLGRDLIISHVGDSRAYLFSEGELQRLTRDQTYVQTLVDAGTITPEQAAAHPMRHVLTDAISTAKSAPEVELLHLRIDDGDRLLLCSDGLTEMVSDSVIAGVLAGPESAEENCRTLVDLALQAGGVDNVTVAIARYGFPSA